MEGQTPAPPLPVPDIDLPLLGRLLLKVEAAAHRSGWDQNPHLRVLYDNTAVDGATDRLYRRVISMNPRFGPPVTVDRYSAVMWFHAGLLGSGSSPWETLRDLAMKLAYLPDNPYVSEMMGLLRQPGVFGFVAVTESWGVVAGDPGGPDAMRRAVRGELNLGDYPGAKETRAVWAVDLADRAHSAHRRRGEKPDLVLDGPYRGDFTTSMRILADAVKGTVPAPELFDERYPTLATLLDRRDSGQP